MSYLGFGRVIAVVLAAAAFTAVFGAAVAEARVAARCPGAEALPGELAAPGLASAVLCLVNQERKRKRLKALSHHPRLAKAASVGAGADPLADAGAAARMIRTDLRKRVIQAGYAAPRWSWTAREITAWGAGEPSSPRAIVDGWMRSAPHRSSILARSLVHAGAWVDLPAGVDEGLVAPSATYVLVIGARERAAA